MASSPTAYVQVPELPDTRCNYCTAPIVWAVTPLRKFMPLDRDATDNGNVCLTWDPEARTWRATVETVWEKESPAWREVPRHVHHGTTCPHAKSWWPSAAKGHQSNVSGVHPKAEVTKPDARGPVSANQEHPVTPPTARPVQESMF